MAAHTLLSHQLLFHHHLGGDASMITAWVPQGGLTTHPVPRWTGETTLNQITGLLDHNKHEHKTQYTT